MEWAETIAKELDVTPDALLHESLRTYLEQRMMKIESQRFLLLKKYGVADISELNQKVQAGAVRENESYEDYFILDHLEAEKEKIREILHTL